MAINQTQNRTFTLFSGQSALSGHAFKLGVDTDREAYGSELRGKASPIGEVKIPVTSSELRGKHDQLTDILEGRK